MLTRREFIGSTAAAVSAASLHAADAAPKRLAIVTTILRVKSHSQHMGDRFLVGYPYAGEWHHANAKVVALYVDQHPEGDLSESRAKEFGFKVYPTVAETVRCGGDKLAVDAVLIIGEHGNYPRNDIGQILYPRYEFFKQVTDVFEKDGRVVPVYNDKHLSYSFEKAKKMVDTSHRMNFPMLGGSSVPVTFRIPDIDIPYGAEIEEALMVGEGGSDPMDFHALEGLQCMVERRKGGETGVKAVQMLEGDAVWEAGAKGLYSRELLTAALSRSDTPMGLTVKDGRTQDLVADNVLPSLVPHPGLYIIEYRDGLRATLLMLTGAIRDYNFAARVKGRRDLISTQFLLTPDPNVTYSACLMHKVEEMFTTGVAPYPIERTLLTSGILEGCLKSAHAMGGKRLETPYLDVRYRSPRESQYMRS